MCFYNDPSQYVGSSPDLLGQRIAHICVRLEKDPVFPWATGRDRASNPGHPRAPARLRAGGTVWRRTFGSPPLGDPATSRGKRQLGHAWERVRRNRLRCRSGSCRSSGGSGGGMPSAALADGEGMATAQKALGLPDRPKHRLRALRPRRVRKSSLVRRAAWRQARPAQPRRRKNSVMQCLHTLRKLPVRGRRGSPGTENLEPAGLRSLPDPAILGSRRKTALFSNWRQDRPPPR